MLAGVLAWVPAQAAPVISASSNTVHVGDTVTFTVQDQPTAICDASPGGLCNADIELVYDAAIFSQSSLQIVYATPFDSYSYESGGIVSLLAFFDDLGSGTQVQPTTAYQTLFTFALTALADSGSGPAPLVGLQAPEMGAYGSVSATPADPDAGTPAIPAFTAPPLLSVTVLPAVSAVPEPTSALLALSGLAGVAALRRKRRPA